MAKISLTTLTWILILLYQLHHKETEFNLENCWYDDVWLSRKRKNKCRKWSVTSDMGEFKTDSGNLLVSFFLGGSLVLKVQVDHSLRNPLQA